MSVVLLVSLVFTVCGTECSDGKSEEELSNMVKSSSSMRVDWISLDWLVTCF
jgi:hypothetical protein